MSVVQLADLLVGWSICYSVGQSYSRGSSVILSLGQSKGHSVCSLLPVHQWVSMPHALWAVSRSVGSYFSALIFVICYVGYIDGLVDSFVDSKTYPGIVSLRQF